MATAIRPFEAVQIGKETVAGTRVAATRKLVGAGLLKEEVDRYYSSYPRGLRATVGGMGVTLRRGTVFTMETELNAEEILWPLSMGVKGGVTPVGAGADKTWTFTPTLNVLPTLDTATIEFAESDGSTNQIYTEAGYCLSTGFKCDWPLNGVAKLSWTGFGRARQTDTITPAMVPYPTREELVSPNLLVYADNTYAGMGGTLLSAVVRSATFECMTNHAPDYTADARADLDFTSVKFGNLAGKLSLVLELNATAATEFANWRANTQRYIRLKSTGNAIGAGFKTVQIDGSYRVVGTPTFSVDGDFELMTLELEAVYDATGGKILEFVIINGLATI